MKKTVREIVEFLKQCKREHRYSDGWYSCPKAVDQYGNKVYDTQGDECNCGADAFNRKIDEFIEKLGGSDDNTNI